MSAERFESKSLNSPEEVRKFDNGKVEIVNVAGAAVGRATFEPGWKWSTSVKPIAGTDSCQSHHVGYCLEGAIHVVHDGGDELDIGPGAVYEILPGHDAWVVGDDTFQALEFVSKTAEQFAK